MSSCSAGDKEFAKELLALIQGNWKIINPNALGKGITYITWASAKVSPIVFSKSKSTPFMWTLLCYA